MNKSKSNKILINFFSSLVILMLLFISQQLSAQNIDTTNNTTEIPNDSALLISINNDTIIDNDTIILFYLENDSSFSVDSLSKANLDDTLPFVVTESDDVMTVSISRRGVSDLDEPVHYSFSNKGKLDFNAQKAYLYTEADVTYGSINLQADYMEVDFDTKEIFANGVSDSTGTEVKGKPKFLDGESEYLADTMRYNFKTKRALVKNVATKMDDGFLYGNTTKLFENKHVHILDGKFTTCDNPDCPHFYFRLTRAVVIPKDKIVTKLTYMIISEVPTPLALPFGFFPISNDRHSGIIIPTPGSEDRRGLFLTNGGYYFAINEYVDLTLLGDIYTKGTWGIGANVNYKWRYKFDGYFNAKYKHNVLGYSGIPGYQTGHDYSIIWRFNQDQHFRPNSTFSADVNISSSKYKLNNEFYSDAAMTSTQSSSISYTRNFANTPFNLSAAFRHTQNNQTGRIDFNLPDVTFSMSQVYPFKRKVQKGGQKWYEQIGIAYTTTGTNRIKTNENSFLTIPADSITNGISHRIPVSTTIKLFKYTTLRPNFTYNERWYFKSMTKQWVDTSTTGGYVESLYKPGFNRVWDYSAGVNWSTQLFGTYQFLPFIVNLLRIKSFRHMFTPTVGFNFVQDLSKPKFKMYDNYFQIRYSPTTGQYDTIPMLYAHFEGLPYGGPGNSGAGLITFNLDNNLELKIKNKNSKDTLSDDKKVKLLDNLSINANYNIFADSLNWSPININARTHIALFDINFRTTLDPYGFQYNGDSPVRINQWAYKVNTSDHKIVRLTSMYFTVGASLNPKAKNTDKTVRHYKEVYGQPVLYADWDVPWDVHLDYSFNLSKPYNRITLTQSINASGSVSLTQKWKVTVSTGYDFIRKEITYTTLEITRDLHCWEASLNLRPFGTYKSYEFQINVKSSMLQDLKYKKAKTWYDNVGY